MTLTNPARRATACMAVAVAVIALLWWFQLSRVEAPQSAPWLYDDIRLATRDRLLAATVIGAAIGAAGLLFRIATANPLADPAITGVNAGAALGAVATAFVLGNAATSLNQVPGALAGAAVAVAISLGIGLGGGSRIGGALAMQRLILVGMAVSALCSAVTSILLVLDEAQLSTVMSWLAGRLAGLRLADCLPALVACAVVLPLAMVGGRSLDLLAAGDAVASSVGANPVRTRVAAIAAGVLLVAPSVAASGPIGFLGIIAATVAHRVCGPRHRLAVPAAAATGAAVLLAADVAGQALWAPAETPVGIITSLAGFPLVLWGVARIGERRQAKAPGRPA